MRSSDHAGRAVFVFASLFATGCVLPVNWDTNVTTQAMRGPLSDRYSDVGVEIAQGIRSGSSGLAFGVSLGEATAVDRTQWAQPRFLLFGGTGHVPRPFEGRLGYEITGHAGVAWLPVGTTAIAAPVAGPRASLLIRLTASHEVWREDERPTRELFLVAGAQGLVAAPAWIADHDWRVEGAVLLGLRLTCYSNEAP